MAALALVVAHPDDDACGMAGTVALHSADPEFRFILVAQLAGLKGHRSQAHVMSDPTMSDEAWARTWGQEHLVIAWPRTHAGSPRLRDVFEGL